MRSSLAFTVAICLLSRAHLPAAANGPPCSDMLGAPMYQPQEPSCDVPPRAPVQPPTPEQPRAPVPQAPLAPQMMPQAMMAAPAPGMFVQPPATGRVRGAVEQRGIEGASITFPSVTFHLPSIRLPAFSRTRSNARMEIDEAFAPYQQGYPMSTAFAPAHAPMMAAGMPMQMPASAMVQAPAGAPLQSPPATTPQQAPPAAPRQPGVPSPPPDAPFAPRMPGCDAPQSPLQAPSCDAYPNKHALLDDRLRTLEEAERRLAQRMEELQRLQAQISQGEQRQAEQAASARRLPPAPEPMLQLAPINPATLGRVEPTAFLSEQHALVTPDQAHAVGMGEPVYPVLGSWGQ